MLGHAQLRLGQQAAKVLRASARSTQQRIISRAVGIGHCDFRSHMRADAGFLRAHVKARRAVESVAVEQSHGGEPEGARSADQGLPERYTFQAGKRRPSMELNGFSHALYLSPRSLPQP